MSRPKWPVPDNDVLMAELQEWDQATLRERLRRWRFLRQEAEGPLEGFRLLSGLSGGFVYWEAGRSFVAGNFIATVTLVQTFVEHSLSLLLAHKGNALEDRPGSEKLIELAYQQGILDLQTRRTLNGLRKLRNPYVHVDHKKGLTRLLDRSVMEAGGDPYALTERDARRAIEALTDFLRHIMPSWSPNHADAQ